jgi:hypothetical protein
LTSGCSYKLSSPAAAHCGAAIQRNDRSEIISFWVAPHGPVGWAYPSRRTFGTALVGFKALESAADGNLVGLARPDDEVGGGFLLSLPWIGAQ